MLQQNTVETAKENERGVVDIETLQHTQNQLVRTIEETMTIQQEGREKRVVAEQQMKEMEVELKKKLLSMATEKNNKQ
nr:toxic anion resistance protein [Weissella fangxianensis]